MRRLVSIVAILSAATSAGCLDAGTFDYVSGAYGANPFEEGFFTWNAGKGGLVWASSAPSDDPGGPLEPQRVAAAPAAWNLRTNTQGQYGTAQIPRDDFVSDPFPKERWLNVSRPIELDINITALSPDPSRTNPCAGYLFDVEIWLNTTTFVGGWVHRNYGTLSETNPPASASYCPFGLRMHPEVDHIPKGAILTVRVVHVYETTPFQYGLAGGHASHLRIPYYSEVDRSERLGPNPTAAPTPPNTALVVPVLLAASASMPRGRRSAASAILFTVLLSGCLGGSSQKGETSVATSPVATFAVDPGIPIDAPAGYGVISGYVNDTLGDFRPGVHIAVLKTDNATFTNEYGRYRLSAVKAGAQMLIANLEGYHSIQVPLQISERRLYWVNITLKAFVDPTADERRHRHDEWGPATRLPIAVAQEGAVRFGYSTDTGFSALAPAFAATGVSACLWANVVPALQADEACIQQFYLAEEQIILPGTVDLQVTVDWDPSKNKVERVGIGFTPNNVSYQSTWMSPRGRGVATHVRLNWDRTDFGHQRFTMWQFYLYIPFNAGWQTVPIYTSLTQLVTDSFQVTIEATKGIVPREPRHPKFWEKGDTVTPMNAEELTLYGSTLNPYMDHPTRDHGWSPSALTPPGTGRLEVTLESPPPWAPSNLDWGLVMKPANLRPEAPLSDYIPVSPKRSEGNKKFYEIPLKPEETDQFYQASSNWRWLLDDSRDGGAVIASVPPENKVFRLTVKAIRDPDL